MMAGQVGGRPANTGHTTPDEVVTSGRCCYRVYDSIVCRQHRVIMANTVR